MDTKIIVKNFTTGTSYSTIIKYYVAPAGFNCEMNLMKISTIALQWCFRECMST